MSFADVGIAALVLYIAALVVLAELAHRSRRDDAPSDHFLAGRGLGVFVLFLTLYATAYSGNSLLGYPGRAYASGFSFIMATGFMMSIIVVFHVLVPGLRPAAVAWGFITPGDWVRHRFGVDSSWREGGDVHPLVARGLVLGVGILMTLALANFLLAQLKAMGHVTSLVTEQRIPSEVGIVGLAVLILFYETRGGMRAVAWTDAAQGVLMMFGLAALLFWLVGEAGGLEAVTREVRRTRPEAVAIPDARVCASWFSTIALLGLASVLYPQAIQRIFAARSGPTLTRSLALMTFMPLVTTLVVTLIGIAAIPRIDVGIGAAASDHVMPLLLGEWAAAGRWGIVGGVLVFIGALAAIMSTADSCLLSLGSLVARDLLGRSGSDPETTRLGKLVAGGLLFATVPLAMLEVSLWRLIELKMELLIQCVPAFLLALHWPRQNALATLVGLVVGTLFGVGLTLAGIPRLWGVHVGVVGLGVNLCIVFVGSLARSPDRVRREPHTGQLRSE